MHFSQTPSMTDVFHNSRMLQKLLMSSDHQYHPEISFRHPNKKCAPCPGRGVDCLCTDDRLNRLPDVYGDIHSGKGFDPPNRSLGTLRNSTGEKTPSEFPKRNSAYNSPPPQHIQPLFLSTSDNPFCNKLPSSWPPTLYRKPPFDCISLSPNSSNPPPTTTKRRNNWRSSNCSAPGLVLAPTMARTSQRIFASSVCLKGGTGFV